ncbi:septal ring lytic transglycosylase RlpA family protein [Acidovorax cavernicola]|uniref:Endolytic peptidoglycan transglycosylase RlpA n=1 Tax=Acidovorax cavernicola TaxID=1675792 RepID=A0A9X8D865_9BURK|nr:septal ring lytic transglycosylase RlpA family protein [Acidovorax cavernicola]RIX84194.1 septal ring lytic transglycosylase RlpA family protein [Acidovorax cavernicola]
MPPATQEKDADTAAAPASSAKRLQPLGRGLAVPPGAAARSNVPSVRYDLAVSGTGEALDDGVPGDEPREIFERGGASWYGIQFHQRKTANGERFDMGAMTAAHKTLAFNTRVCVRSLVNGSEVLVRINDRGPFTPGRIIDLSRAAADRIGLTGLGIKQVALSVIDREGMRCGGETVAADDLQAAPEAPTSRARAPAPARKRAAVPPRKRR